MISNSLPQEQHSAEAGESTGGGRGRPEHFHARQLEQFSEALATDGTAALNRWGFPMFHSLPDEVAEEQRQKLGFKAQDALDHYNHGCLLAARNDFSGAVKAFEAALKINPELAEADFNRALAFEQGGYSANAREAWKQYLEKYPESEDVDEVKQHLTTLAG